MQGSQTYHTHKNSIHPHQTFLASDFKGIWEVFFFWTLPLMCLFCFSPSNREEIFNLRHSSLCIIIVRKFGVLKLDFKILTVDSKYKLKQKFNTVIASACVHNMNLLCNGKYDQILLEAESSSNKAERISVEDTAED
ncbi:uncharacterized protein VP01_887g9 [Puccinia sorghi]|uniref:DDE Tnp4 domain-containing protein n=1 Tax=Puccinia sorghi TaxID=27349 RepID=A0A0L6U864_9BASI|nr:uncharacterized protein VP01_887g9 [Puccinia sorghi]